MTYTIPAYNIYFGTIGKTLGCRYKFTRKFRTKEDALKCAKEAATSFYYKNEGRFGLPSYVDIAKESKLLGVPLETLYEEHINDMMRYYAIPTNEDSIPSRKLRW